MRSKRTFRKVLYVAVVSWIATAGQGFAATADPPIDPAEAEVLWRWIGVMNAAGNCPASASLGPKWTVEPLFDVQNPAFDCPELATFCVWEYDGSAGDVLLQDVQCLDEMDGAYDFTTQGSREYLQCDEGLMAALDPDLMALAPAGVLGTAQAPALEHAFLTQTGRIPLPAYPQADPEVWLTLFDTSPNGADGSIPESSPHGATLRRMARKHLCDPLNGGPPGDCVAEVRTRLALAYTSFDPADPGDSVRDEVHGGHVGLVSELAEALVEELGDWAGAGADRLVMNLSVAWNRNYGGTTPVGQMPAGVQAVYRALECASCQDAVVVAAAGNESDLHAGNDLGQPMLPAAWTSFESLACTGRPRLVYAAGGFDVTRRPLSNALASGMPELGAYSDHAVLTSGLPMPTPPLTGSSVSALVVSAAAAAVEYYAPGLNAEGVMAQVYGTGEITSVDADICGTLTGSCPKVSYVSVCESAHGACQGGCPVNLPDCPPRSGARPVFWASDLSALVDATSDTFGFSLFPLPGCAAVCLDDLPLAAPGFPVNPPCPRRQHHARSRRPGTHPQPEVPLCPSCLYDTAGGTLYAELEAGQNVDVESPTLHLMCSGLPSTHQVPISVNTLGATTLTGLPTGCTSAAFSSDLYENSVLLGSSTVPVLIGNVQ